MVKVNEEDHVRLISLEHSRTDRSCLLAIVKSVNAISSKVDFVRHPKLGWLAFCPTNVGTGIRASVILKVPKISAREDFKKTCEKLGLQIRGSKGEHSKSVDGSFDISNKRRVGLNEFDAVKIMYDGVKKLIELEKSESAPVLVEAKYEPVAVPAALPAAVNEVAPAVLPVPVVVAPVIVAGPQMAAPAPAAVDCGAYQRAPLAEGNVTEDHPADGYR